MKYLVAANSADLNAKIAKLFGYAPYYLIVDTETMEYLTVQGIGHDEPSHGMSRFANLDIKHAIVGNIGPAAFKDLISIGWSVFSCHGMTVMEALEKVRSDMIPHLEKPTMKVSIRSANKTNEHKHVDRS
ncbi:MAG: NifB/NifX family molybdenum-iron cluster-binding protein [Candidatus Hatepunaea meridiana]|nr:NifB/NifX family molybdenum-iron cluster-binding protein [Candidatus Hatepunaea meridiana]